MTRRSSIRSPLESWLNEHLARREYIEVSYADLLGAAGLPVACKRARFAEVLNLIGALGHPISLPLTSTLGSKVRVLPRPSVRAVRITRFDAGDLPPVPRSPSRKQVRSRPARPAPLAPIELGPGKTYRVLSIQPPWAWAVIFAGKDVENRSWSTRHRGPLLIHASSKKFVGEELEDLRHDIAATGGLSLDEVPAEFPRSQILGLVDLIDVVDDSSSPWAGGDEEWVLARPRPLARTILNVKGKLNLWSWTA